MNKVMELKDQKLDLHEKEIESIESNKFKNVSIGGKNHLYIKLKESIKKAKSIDIVVSFLMESGVKLILNDLKEAIERNVKIRILTGSYLNITQPSALYMLKRELKDNVDLRLFSDRSKSFHPKSYIFHYEDDSEIYIGSSNISRGALTSSIEWNYKFLKSKSPKDFNEFYIEFQNLFNNYSDIACDEVLKNYSESWKRPQVYKDIERENSKKHNEENKTIELFEPRGAQIEALYRLENSRIEGFNKGVAVLATGVGKTYLAAFDSKDAKKILFVAHREEIIKQAAASFRNVRKSDDIGFFYKDKKDKENSMIFALVQTLGKDEYLNEDFFGKDHFDYIVIDEFHHAVSGNYKKIIDYFKPKFLLGLTATPERLDSKDVFALCDYNTVYEIRLSDAINKGYLVPFRYYGIYDETVNYEDVEFKNGKYNEKELEEVLMINKRAQLILNHYKKYNSECSLGFCKSKNHAEYMAKYFSNNGVKSASVYSGETGEYSSYRSEAIKKLTKGEIKVIFSVDMFNEGLDIPAIDMVMFLRPTESPTVFLQQLGRGLRKYKDKKYLNVLDFIGNYKKADLLPFLLSGKKYSKITSKRGIFNEEEYPEDCRVDFDFRIIDVFKKLAQKEMNIKEKISEEFFRVKEILGYRPTRVEFFNGINDEVYSSIKKTKSSLNPFNDYLGFLNENNELSKVEEGLLNTKAHQFIKMIETTSMSKSYKIPVFHAFYNNGNIKTVINEDDIYESFYKFYNNGSNKVDMLRHKSTAGFEDWSKKEYVKLAKDNPIKFLLKSEGEFFAKSDDVLIALDNEVDTFVNNDVFIHEFIDAIEYRTLMYYKDRNLK